MYVLFVHLCVVLFCAVRRHVSALLYIIYRPLGDVVSGTEPPRKHALTDSAR